MKISSHLFVSLLLSALASGASALELRVVAADVWGPPYIFSGQDKAREGLVKDVVEAFAKEAKVSVVYSNLPRKRIELEIRSGSIHISPISNPDWYADHQGLEWSDPIFEEKNLFILKPDSKLKIESLRDLQGKKIGTMLGYVYPNLTEDFVSGGITRVDVNDHLQLRSMLQRGRVDTFISSDIVFRYLEHSNPQAQKLKVADFILAQHSIQWCVSKSSPIKVQRINEILAKLKSSGKLAEIMKKYLG